MAELTLAQQRLVERHIEFARRLARTYWWRGDDALSDAYLGLTQAAQRFDPRSGVKFSTFAYRRILGAVRDGCRRDGGRGKPVTRPWHEPVHDGHTDSGDDLATLADVVRDPRPTPEEAHMRQDARDELAGAISRLPARTQAMIRQRFWYGWPQNRVAAVHHLHESRVSQIMTGALNKRR